ncbi:MAG: serine/threonine protein kinase [Planctomycetota bacterium]|nr:MAG: serine/threonine protein kinase [Planctomycetota bacterium]
MASDETQAPAYPERRRSDVNTLFRATRTPLPSDLRAQARSVAARLFGLDDAASGPAGPGDRLGSYRILRVLGVGGQATVYEAEHVELGRRVSLKVPRRDVAERLLREARMAARLEHPRIVRVEDVGEHEGPGGAVPYLVMEYLEGGSLEHLLEEHPGGLPLDEVRRIGRAVLEALDAAHRRGVVHRDVKPSNVLFDAAGEPKLADLGIGLLSSGDLDHSVEFSRLTRDGAAVGTPLYMAPEQEDPSRLRGADLDGRADLFSFGKMLFVMLTGASPSTIRPASRLRPELDPAWDELIFRLLEEDRERRPATAAAVIEALDAIPAAATDAPAAEEAPAVEEAPAGRAGEVQGRPAAPTISVRPRERVPVARWLAPDDAASLPYLLSPRSRLAAGIYNLFAFASAFFAGYVAFLLVRGGALWRWQTTAGGALVVGAALAANFLWTFQRGEVRAERSLGPGAATILSLLFAGWAPLLFVGRYGRRIGPFQPFAYPAMPLGEYKTTAWSLVGLSLLVGLFVSFIYRRRRRRRARRKAPRT